MTIYVDDVRIPARVGRLNTCWSHLTVGPDDDIAELHAFAAKIGLRKTWFQAKGWPRDHYDVTDSKRQAAIEAGAVAIPWRDAARMRIEAIARRREADTAAITGAAPVAAGCAPPEADGQLALPGTGP